MSWQIAGPLPDIPTRWTMIHREVGGPGPCCKASRGSREYDGEAVRVLLGATVKKVN